MSHEGLFYTNMQWVQYCRRNGRQIRSYGYSCGNTDNLCCVGDGVVRFCPPVPGNKAADWTDPSYDIGVYAAGMLNPLRHSSPSYVAVVTNGDC